MCAVVVPSLRCVPISDAKYPRLLVADWVAPNATVIGDVRMEEGASLWHGVVVRGDQGAVSIGKNSIVQDLSQLYSTKGGDIHIGDNACISPNCTLDGCTIESFAFVGMGASVGHGATVESFAVVGAGAVVPPGATVPSGQIWAGSPAKYLRDLTQEEKHLINEQQFEMQQLSQIYAEETEKNFREQVAHRDQLMKYQL